MQRDSYFGENSQIASYSDLVAFIQRMNSEWITATKRLSPEIIISLLETAEKEYYTFIKKLELDKPAIWPVAWAGENESYNWFDIARDYTEKWHHQMQIREAICNKSDIFNPKFVKPVYEIFMNALPFVYKDVEAEDKTLIIIHIVGKCGGTWHLYRNNNKWELSDGKCGLVKTEVTIKDDIAWKLFTNSIRENKNSYLKIEGNTEFGLRVSDMVTVMS